MGGLKEAAEDKVQQEQHDDDNGADGGHLLQPK